MCNSQKVPAVTEKKYGYLKETPSKETSWTENVGEDVVQLAKRQTGTSLTQIQFPDAAKDFSCRVNFQCKLSHGVHTQSCAIACADICVHVEDSVVPVRVQWIMETPEHPACTVVRLCYSWLSPGTATRISYRKNPNGIIQLQKKKN